LTDTPPIIKIVNHIIIDRDREKKILQDNMDPINKSGEN